MRLLDSWLLGTHIMHTDVRTSLQFRRTMLVRKPVGLVVNGDGDNIYKNGSQVLAIGSDATQPSKRLGWFVSVLATKSKLVSVRDH